MYEDSHLESDYEDKVSQEYDYTEDDENYYDDGEDDDESEDDESEEY